MSKNEIANIFMFMYKVALLKFNRKIFVVEWLFLIYFLRRFVHTTSFQRINLVIYDIIV
jgi:hypothetical protein